MHACIVEYPANNSPYQLLSTVLWMLTSNISPSKAAKIFNDFILGERNHNL